MTWSMEASGSEPFELNARARSGIFNRDPFDDEPEEGLENGELDDDDEDEDDEDDDELEDDDEFDDDEEEEEEAEDDL